MEFEAVLGEGRHEVQTTSQARQAAAPQLPSMTDETCKHAPSAEASCRSCVSERGTLGHVVGAFCVCVHCVRWFLLFLKDVCKYMFSLFFQCLSSFPSKQTLKTHANWFIKEGGHIVFITGEMKFIQVQADSH